MDNCSGKMDDCNEKTVVCDRHLFDYLDMVRLVNLKLWTALILNLKPDMCGAYLVDRPESAEMAVNVCIDLVDAIGEGEL